MSLAAEVLSRVEVSDSPIIARYHSHALSVHPMRDNTVLDLKTNPRGVQRSLMGVPPVEQQIRLEASGVHHHIKEASSSAFLLPEPPVVLSMEQYNLLATLGRGEGITFTERDYLFEMCHGCGLVFVASAIKGHAVLCRRRRG